MLIAMLLLACAPEVDGVEVETWDGSWSCPDMATSVVDNVGQQSLAVVCRVSDELGSDFMRVGWYVYGDEFQSGKYDVGDWEELTRIGEDYVDAAMRVNGEDWSWPDATGKVTTDFDGSMWTGRAELRTDEGRATMRWSVPVE